MYTEEQKYNGEGDNFDFKLTIFWDICERANIPEEPSPTVADFLDDLRSCITTWEKTHKDSTHTDTYISSDRRFYKQDQCTQDRPPQRYTPRKPTRKHYFVCSKEGCISYKHTERKHEKSKQRFHKNFRQYLVEYEGEDGEDNNEKPEDDDSEDELNEYETLMISVDNDEDLPSSTTIDIAEIHIISISTVNPQEATKITEFLADQGFRHVLINTHGSNDPGVDILSTYTNTTTDKYSSEVFQGIMIDTGASKRFTASYNQYLAYQKLGTTILIDTSTKGSVSIQFGIGTTSSIGSIDLSTPLGVIQFHIKDVCYLTEIELRRLHCRFGYPSVERLRKILERSRHDVDDKVLQYLSKYYKYCQKHNRSPGRFKFTLQNDVKFNYAILVDVMYINNKPVLHIVDEATGFQVTR
ncbi:hypothetical protein F5884DRAFT_869701 [Xylogone sp. PMI_703]|nr:hypothetical protein F5884DRAFT_869701 [Xylogone sp. PMI_703]